MVVKNVQMKHKNATGWDEINPITKSENVFNHFGIPESMVNGLTKRVVDIYVDSVNGQDTPSSGTESKPYKTLQYAADRIPKVINYDRFIWCADGIYDEAVVFKSIVGAAIVIGRKGGIVSASSPTGLKVRSIVFFDCNGLCRVNNFEQVNASAINGSAFVRFSRCGYGTAHALRCNDTNITVDAVEHDGTNGSVNSSYFNGQRVCVISKNGSNVRIDSTNEHGQQPSATGALAQAADIYINGAAEWLHGASNALAQSQGGQINRQIDVLDLTPLLKNGWTAYPGNQHTPRAIRHNGVVFLQGIIQGGQVGQGIEAFKLPSLWTPQFNNRVTHPFSSDGQTTKMLVDIHGVCAVEVHTGQYISLSDTPPFYVGF